MTVVRQPLPPAYRLQPCCPCQSFRLPTVSCQPSDTASQVPTCLRDMPLHPEDTCRPDFVPAHVCLSCPHFLAAFGCTLCSQQWWPRLAQTDRFAWHSFQLCGALVPAQDHIQDSRVKGAGRIQEEDPAGSVAVKRLTQVPRQARSVPGSLRPQSAYLVLMAPPWADCAGLHGACVVRERSVARRCPAALSCMAMRPYHVSCHQTSSPNAAANISSVL